MSSRDYMRPRVTTVDQPLIYRAVVNGWEPAEVLTPHDRRVLITNYVHTGLTDQQIAGKTLWTDYTVARIRDDIGLAPNTAKAA